MILLLLKLSLAPLAVVIGTVAQRRFGHAVGGLIVGLPLASLPLLWMVARQYGSSFASAMTGALLVGSIAEVVVLWLYARLTSRLSPWLALGGALSAFALSAGAVDLLKLSAAVAGTLTALGFVVALRLWPASATTTSEVQGRSRLVQRVVLAALFTVVLVALAGHLGPVLAGLIDALPAMSLMMAFTTHQDHGAAASSRFLRGVTRGSFSYVAAMLVLAELLRTGDLLIAFAAALAAALVVQGVLQAFDSLVRVRSLGERTVNDSREPVCA